MKLCPCLLLVSTAACAILSTASADEKIYMLAPYEVNARYEPDYVPSYTISVYVQPDDWFSTFISASGGAGINATNAGTITNAGTNGKGCAGVTNPVVTNGRPAVLDAGEKPSISYDINKTSGKAGVLVQLVTIDLKFTNNSTAQIKFTEAKYVDGGWSGGNDTNQAPLPGTGYFRDGKNNKVASAVVTIALTFVPDGTIPETGYTAISNEVTVPVVNQNNEELASLDWTVQSGGFSTKEGHDNVLFDTNNNGQKVQRGYTVEYGNGADAGKPKDAHLNSSGNGC